MPKSDGALLHDEAIQVSLHDVAHVSRVAPPLRYPFAHNEVRSLHTSLRPYRDRWRARVVFVAVESVSSMDKTVFLLRVMFDAMNQVFSADW